MGTPLDSNFCTDTKIFQFRPGYIWAYKSKSFSVRLMTFVYYSIWTKNFNFCQKSYRKKTRIFFFTHKKIISYSQGPRMVYKSKFVSVGSKIFLYDSFLTRGFLSVKTPTSIQWFEVHFWTKVSSLWDRIKKWLHRG